MKRVPPVIVVGLALGIAAALLTVSIEVGDVEFLAVARSVLARMASAVAENVLVALGLFALARRTTGRAYTMLRVAGALLLVVAAWYLLRPVLDVFVDREKRWVFDLFRWGFFASGLLMLGAVLAIAAASRAPVFALLAVIAVLARGWIPGVTDELHRYLFDHREVAVAYWLVESLLFAAGIVGMTAAIAKQATPVASAPDHAAGGFHYVSNGLRLRVVGAVVFALLATTMTRSHQLEWFVLIGAPAVVVLTLAIVAIGLVRVAHAAVADLPPWRLAIGAGLTLWFAVVQYEQIVHLFRDHKYVSGMAEGFSSAWSIGGPLLVTAALGLVGSAISAFAQARTSDELRESAGVRTLLFVILSASAVGIQSQMHKLESRDSAVLLTIVAAGAAIGGLLAFAGLAKQAADTIGEGASALPRARVTSKP